MRIKCLRRYWWRKTDLALTKSFFLRAEKDNMYFVSPSSSLSYYFHHDGSLCFQVGVFSYPASCDSRSVLQQLCYSSSFLLNQGVGDKEGAGYYKLRGSMSGCGWGACTSMPAGWHHQDGVPGDSLDVPFWCCEYKQYEVISIKPFLSSRHHLLHIYVLFHRFSLSGQPWKKEESSSANLGGNILGLEFSCSHIWYSVKISTSIPTTSAVVNYKCIRMISIAVIYSLRFHVLVLCLLWIKYFWI